MSLLELFAGEIDDDIPNGRLRLPEYQRPYRWSSEQVAQLASDLAHHFEGSAGHDYYLGSLILHHVDNGWLNIIDGQQRLTSVGILCVLAQETMLPDLCYSAPESMRRIRDNLAILRRSNLRPRLDLARINVTLVITSREDDAYRFFETQNSGGVRLSGIDIAKAHHLRVVDRELQNGYARQWEKLEKLGPVVECVMRVRHWQSLDWRELASATKRPIVWRNQVVHELAVATGDEGADRAYQLTLHDRVQQDWQTAPMPWRYDMRQPLQAGANSIHYLEQFHTLLHQYCPDADGKTPHDGAWPALYVKLVAQSKASSFLRQLFDAALVLYVSRFGDGRIVEAGLWLFRSIYSLRLSNEMAVRESSVQRFVRLNPVLDWVAHSYTHAQVIGRLRAFRYTIKPENLEVGHRAKPRHVQAVCKALNFALSHAKPTAAQIVDQFDDALCRAIDECCIQQVSTS
ncbi:DUF262 domain-containing protein [Paraburkholderia sp. C35]|uniref:DUF262 domain-containing protein n=1 Tax=Paraburkholderia sp. C35 TaxID=2126993 RepID=UPI0013A5A4CA|nr:DUF262 domain-containing protein [Paraburkholderia sp. C35]